MIEVERISAVQDLPAHWQIDFSSGEYAAQVCLTDDWLSKQLWAGDPQQWKRAPLAWMVTGRYPTEAQFWPVS